MRHRDRVWTCERCGRSYRGVGFLKHKTGCRPVMARLVEKCVPGKGAHLGCWVWVGARDGRGYGHMKVAGKARRAHRISYEAYVGPIPQGLTLDHLCRNHSCICPVHLEPVTQRDNVLRGEAPPARHARKTHCDRGHEYTPTNTYQSAQGWRGCRECRRIRRTVGKGRKAVVADG